MGGAHVLSDAGWPFVKLLGSFLGSDQIISISLLTLPIECRLRIPPEIGFPRISGLR